MSVLMACGGSTEVPMAEEIRGREDCNKGSKKTYPEKLGSLYLNWLWGSGGGGWMYYK